jgi:hypothetical protein
LIPTVIKDAVENVGSRRIVHKTPFPLFVSPDRSKNFFSTRLWKKSGHIGRHCVAVAHNPPQLGHGEPTFWNMDTMFEIATDGPEVIDDESTISTNLGATQASAT